MLDGDNLVVLMYCFSIWTFLWKSESNSEATCHPV